MKSYLLEFALAGLERDIPKAKAILDEPLARIGMTLDALRESFDRADYPLLVACLRLYLQALEQTEPKECFSTADSLQKLMGVLAIRTREEVGRNE